MPDAFKKGLRDGVPIFLGYFSVSIAFGVQAAGKGLTPAAAMIMSLTNLTSAGQFAALDVIARAGTMLEMALTTLLINLRYLLMSSALSQRMAPDASLPGRLIASYGVTDEIFGISAARPIPLEWTYMLGAIVMAVPGWVGGTAVGALAGELLPLSVTRALGVALYAMFCAIIIPPARKSRVLLGIVVLSMAASWAFSAAPMLREISAGTRVILLTVAIAALAARFSPVGEDAP